MKKFIYLNKIKKIFKRLTFKSKKHFDKNLEFELRTFLENYYKKDPQKKHNSFIKIMMIATLDVLNQEFKIRLLRYSGELQIVIEDLADNKLESSIFNNSYSLNKHLQQNHYFDPLGSLYRDLFEEITHFVYNKISMEFSNIHEERQMWGNYINLTQLKKRTFVKKELIKNKKMKSEKYIFNFSDGTWMVYWDPNPPSRFINIEGYTTNINLTIEHYNDGGFLREFNFPDKKNILTGLVRKTLNLNIGPLCKGIINNRCVYFPIYSSRLFHVLMNHFIDNNLLFCEHTFHKKGIILSI